MLRLTLNPQPLERRLEALTERLRDHARLLAPAVPIVAHVIQRNFEAQGRPTPWAPLAPSTCAERRRSPGVGGRILERTGRLRRSIRTTVEGSVPRAQSGGAIVASTNVPYAASHQFGARIPARIILPRHAKVLRFWSGDRVVFARRARVPETFIPARPFLVLTAEDLDATAQAIAHALSSEHSHAYRPIPQ